MEKKILIVYEVPILKQHQIVVNLLHLILEQQGYLIEELGISADEDSGEYHSRLKRDDVSYIIWIDFAGVFIETMMGGCFYNILRAKQICLVLNEELMGLCQTREFALNVYICPPETGVDWGKEYSHIPNIFSYPRLFLESEDVEDKKVLKDLIIKVMKDCGDV